jgi:hypothetical protein
LQSYAGNLHWKYGAGRHQARICENTNTGGPLSALRRGTEAQLLRMPMLLGAASGGTVHVRWSVLGLAAFEQKRPVECCSEGEAPRSVFNLVGELLVQIAFNFKSRIQYVVYQ